MLKRFQEILITFASKPNKEITMPYPIEKKFVIAVSSSALFDMKKSDCIFRSEGERAYRAYQEKNIDEPLGKGVAFPFIKRILSLH